MRYTSYLNKKFQHCKGSASSKLNYICNSILNKVSLGRKGDINVTIKNFTENVI